MPASLLVALLLGWLTTEAGAQSIETTAQRLLIGKTPWLRLQLRGFELDPAHLGPDCVRIRLMQGDTPLPEDSLQIGAATPVRDGKVQVDVTSSVPLHEPLLHARVELDCGAPFTRELSLLVDPPPAPDPEARPQSRHMATHTAAQRAPPTAVSPPTRPGARQAGRTVGPPDAGPTAARSGIARADPPATGRSPPIRAAAGARLQLDTPDMEQLVSAVLQALPQRPALPARQEERGAAPASLRPFEADWLRELQRLQEEQRQARAQLAALQLRLERQESETLQRWGAMAAIAAGLIAASLLLRLTLERRLPRLSSGEPAGGNVATAQGGTAFPKGSPLRPDPIGSTGVEQLAAEAPPPPEVDDATSSGHTPAVADLPFDTLPTQTLEAGLGLEAPRSPARSWPGADFGEPSLLGRGSAPALRQVDAMSAAGYTGAAVTLLENALQARPGKNPWLLLRLLDLYRTMQQPWNHERVSAQLEALYNVRVPPMRPDGQPGAEGRDLLDCPDLLDRLAQVWSRPATARDWLHQRLLRDGGLPTVDLATFRDLLLLHDLARLRQEEDESLPAN